MDDQQRLAAWVRSEREAGTTKERIWTAAIDAGWDEQQVAAALDEHGALDELGLPGRLPLVLAGVVGLIIVVSVVVGVLLRAGII